jgi:hypothetical protein
LGLAPAFGNKAETRRDVRTSQGRALFPVIKIIACSTRLEMKRDEDDVVDAGDMNGST